MSDPPSSSDGRTRRDGGTATSTRNTAFVLSMEVLVLGGEPAPAAVLGGAFTAFTAFTVQFDLQPHRFVFRCFQLAGENLAGGDGGGEFVASVEGLNERVGFRLALLAYPPGALTISSAGPSAGASAFARGPSRDGSVTLRDGSVHLLVMFCEGRSTRVHTSWFGSSGRGSGRVRGCQGMRWKAVVWAGLTVAKSRWSRVAMVVCPWGSATAMVDASMMSRVRSV